MYLNWMIHLNYELDTNKDTSFFVMFFLNFIRFVSRRDLQSC